MHKVFIKEKVIAMLEELISAFEKYEPKWVEIDEQAVASCRTWEDLDGIILSQIDIRRI